MDWGSVFKFRSERRPLSKLKIKTKLQILFEHIFASDSSILGHSFPTRYARENGEEREVRLQRKNST